MAITRIGPNQSINLASNVTGTLPAANVANSTLTNVTDLPTAVKGMDRLATTSLSSSTSAVLFDVNSNNDSTFNNYSHYIIYMANVLGDASSADIRCRVGVSSSSDIKTGNDYFRNSWAYKPNAGSTLVSSSSISDNYVAIARDDDIDSTSRPQFGELHFFRKGNNGSTMKPGFYGTFYSENTGGYFQAWKFQGSYESALDINYVQITPGSGNFTKGDFTLMGIRNS
tara:strand:- start:257 stop:937 length:681 start_codon:yes stop_codon:yes gene_type:complete